MLGQERHPARRPRRSCARTSPRWRACPGREQSGGFVQAALEGGHVRRPALGPVDGARMLHVVAEDDAERVVDALHAPRPGAQAGVHDRLHQLGFGDTPALQAAGAVLDAGFPALVDVGVQVGERRMGDDGFDGRVAVPAVEDARVELGEVRPRIQQHAAGGHRVQRAGVERAALLARASQLLVDFLVGGVVQVVEVEAVANAVDFGCRSHRLEFSTV